MDGAVIRLARDVTARGVRMRVIEAGTEGRPPVVLLHDFLTSHLEFDDIIDSLAVRFRVLAPDLPGFGASEKPNPARHAYGVESFAESVADLVSAYGVGPANIVGHGLGGAVAITLASQYAELVKRAVLVDPLCYPPRVSLATHLGLLRVGGSFVFKQIYGRRRFRKFFVERVFSREGRVPHERIVELYTHFNTPSARESAYAVFKSMRDVRPVAARISRIRRPALVVWGRDDLISPPALALRLVREMPDARLEFFDAGHSPHEELPTEFVAVVTEFLEGKR